MKKIIVLLMVQSLLSGCGLILLASLSDSSERTYDNPNTAEVSFKQSTVECNEADCPTFAGGLYNLKADKLSVGACSLTLIGPDRVLTNAHCIPDDINHEGATCRGRILINFPKSEGFAAERIECQSVEKIASNSYKVDEPDWAILKLRRVTNRPAAVMNQNGIPDHSDITLYKINFDLYASTPSVGRVRKTQCKGNTNHMDSEESVGPMSALMNLSHCDVKMISGNSGSGYFNSKKQLVGIHSWGLHVLDSDKDWAKRRRAKYPNIKQNVGGGTNLACIPVRNKELPETCSYDTYNYFKLADVYKILRQEKATKEVWTSNAANVFQANQTDNPNIEFTENPLEMVKGLTAEFSGQHEALRKYVFEKIIETRFPSFPKCVSQSSTHGIDVSMLVSQSSSTIDQITFYETQESEIEQVEFPFVEVNSNNLYIYKFPVDSLVYSERLALGWSPYEDVKLTLPSCGN